MRIFWRKLVWGIHDGLESINVFYQGYGRDRANVAETLSYPFKNVMQNHDVTPTANSESYSLSEEYLFPAEEQPIPVDLPRDNCRHVYLIEESVTFVNHPSGENTSVNFGVSATQVPLGNHSPIDRIV